ncbi:hypothetical protein CY34DRAFT_92730 [Suillus luteus UH-Slu-Lm8-n1]|uniref:Reverse transcriptase zinc-binding domain-containing protein n=1 Tax=Suillus luteus UH-Slu-Lm8-n1 TaxID=930992 RepID=A0A0C9ZJ25_9AGAM|nr:hypothetical protein CY34DRAFT_92730 [Suillus luteus UH-Slu-Lm8-n1]
MPSNKFVKLVATLPKCQSSLYIQLHTRHTPLNHYLHHIGKNKLPHCPFCPDTDETVHHYLLDCPQYSHEHHILRNTLCRKASSISYLLTSEEVTQPLMRFISSSGRFKSTFSEISTNTT